MFSKIFLTKFSKAIKASWNGKTYQGACLLVATCCSFLHPHCSLLQIDAKVKYTQHAADIYLQSSNWDHSGNLVHQIVVSIAFLIKFSKSVGHCCKCREAVDAYFHAAGCWNTKNSLSKCQFTKWKLQSLKKSLPSKYVFHCYSVISNIRNLPQSIPQSAATCSNHCFLLCFTVFCTVFCTHLHQSALPTIFYCYDQSIYHVRWNSKDLKEMINPSFGQKFYGLV